MRPGFLLGLVIASLFFSQMLFGKKDSLAPKLSVRQEFDSSLSNLKKNLKANIKPEDKWKALSKSEKDIELLRKKNPVQVDQDEIYMDLVTDSLKQIPRGTAFKKEECDGYRAKLRSAYDPKSVDKVIPPIAETFSVLDQLCN